MQKLSSDSDGVITVFYGSNSNHTFSRDMIDTFDQLTFQRGDEIELNFTLGGYKYVIVESSDKKYRLYDIDTMFGIAVIDPELTTINDQEFIVYRTVNQLGGKITMTIK